MKIKILTICFLAYIFVINTNIVKAQNLYIERFKTLRGKIYDPANKYFSKDGIPYHSSESLLCEAPDHGHETTSEAMSYWIQLDAMHGRVSGDWAPLNSAWAKLEKYTIPDTKDFVQPSYNANSPATYAGEGDLPSYYPSQLVPAGQAPVGKDPISAELTSNYGSFVYGMHWLFDCDNFYGFGNKADGVSTPSYINTFQRGVQESVFETVPQPSWDEFKWGGKYGYLDLFTKEANVPAKQWKYTNAPDADARCVQALYWASEWVKAQGKDPLTILPLDKGKMMGDYLRLAMFDKYFKPMGCQDVKAPGATGYESAHYLMSWYYAWGGPIGNTSWAWRIGCSHNHFGYQNPVTAYALSAYNNLIPKSATAKRDWGTSLDRQLEMYTWLQSAEGAIAGGATNSWNGRYEKYPTGTPTFYGMAYVENPVYNDPGSNTWFGFQAWSIERVAEYYYMTNDPRAKKIMDKWITWAKSEVHLLADGTFEIPVGISWTGKPETWNPTAPASNTGLHVTIDSYNQDIGITASLAKTFTFYAAATQKYETLNVEIKNLAKELLDRMWTNYYEPTGKGVAVTETRADYNKRFFDQEVYVPAGWKGVMPNGDSIKPGIKFLDIRTNYKNDPDYNKLLSAYNNKVDYTTKYHRFWAQAEVALANAEYGYLFGVTTTYSITASAGTGGSITPTGVVTVSGGADQNFTITPSSGFKVADVKVDGTSVGAVTSYKFTSVAANHTISASFVTTPTYTITATAGAGGSISPSGTVIVNEAGSQTFAIVPATGYKIADVKVNGVSKGAIASFTFTTVVANQTIAATFSAVPSFIITATATLGGSITPAGSVSVQENTDKTFTIAAANNYKISDVKVDGVSLGAINSYTFMNVTSTHTITASFEESLCNLLTLFGAPTTAALASLNTNYKYVHVLGNHSAISNITAFTINWDLANKGLYQFSINTNNGVPNWYVDLRTSMTYKFDAAGATAKLTGTGANLDGDYYVVTKDANLVLVDKAATYAIVFSNIATPPAGCGDVTNYTITASAGTGGSISPSGAILVASGSNKTFTIAASAGYKIAGLTIDGVSQAAAASYTFSNVTANHTIAASFVANPTYTITATAGTGGTITPSGIVNVASGAGQTFVIAPSAGYKIAGLTIDGVSQAAAANYTFSNITANHTIAASFVTNPTYTITATAGTGGTITPSGIVNVASGAGQTFAIAASNGYKIAGLTIDGVLQAAAASYAFSNVTANHTIAASFVIDNNPCDLLSKYSVPRSSALPTMANISYTHSYTLGTGGPTLSNVTNFTINWDLANKGLYQFSMNTSNGVPSWWVDLLPKISQTFSVSSPACKLTATGISGLDGDYWANVDGANLVLVAKSGAYALYFTNGTAPSGCTVKSAKIETSIKSSQANEISMLPNPVDKNGILSLNLREVSNGANYVILDLSGKTILSGALKTSENNISVNGKLSNGIYLVKISNGNEQLIQKLIVK